MPKNLTPIFQGNNGQKCPNSISGAALKVEARQDDEHLYKNGYRIAGVTPSLPNSNSTEKQGVAQSGQCITHKSKDRRFKSDRQAAGGSPIGDQLMSQPVDTRAPRRPTNGQQRGRVRASAFVTGFRFPWPTNRSNSSESGCSERESAFSPVSVPLGAGFSFYRVNQG